MTGFPTGNDVDVVVHSLARGDRKELTRFGSDCPPAAQPTRTPIVSRMVAVVRPPFKSFVAEPTLWRAELSGFWSDAEDDVEPRCELADARAFNGCEVDDDGFAQFRVLDA